MAAIAVVETPLVETYELLVILTHCVIKGINMTAGVGKQPTPSETRVAYIDGSILQEIHIEREARPWNK